MKSAALFVSFGIAVGVWWGCSFAFGTTLVPSPAVVAEELFKIGLHGDTWLTIAVTVARGLAGLTLALIAAVVLGIAAGSSSIAMKMLNPLVVALQSCPPILWITLLMIWVGTGSVVPIVVCFASVFPPLFSNVAQGRLSIDRRLFDMSKLYRVKKWRVFSKIVLPGIAPYVLAGLSYAASTSWKVTAFAEFLGSSTGIGAKIYWAYRMLEISQLFAWASIVVLLGVYLELGIIAPLRKNVAALGTKREAI